MMHRLRDERHPVDGRKLLTGVGRGTDRSRLGRVLCALLVVSGVTTVASGVMSGTAGATDASAGGCIKAHPPELVRVGPTSAAVSVDYNDDCAFPAQVGVKYYRPGGNFLREHRQRAEGTKGGWKTATFYLSDLPDDKLFQIQSLVENFGTEFSSTIDFSTRFAHPTSLTLDANPVKSRSGADNGDVAFKATAGGLFDKPSGTTVVLIESSINGRKLDPVTATYNGCALQSTTCTWSYTMEHLPVGKKLTVTALFENLTYAESFPNRKTTKPMGVIVGSGNVCSANTEKVRFAYCAP